MTTLCETNEPTKLLGKDFERLIIAHFQREERENRAICGRYGVQASIIDGKWTPIQSLPDFEGILMNGPWFTFEAKVCSAASFPIADNTKFKDRQLRHLRARADFGAVAFLLIHFNERRLKSRIDEAQTWAFPVDRRHLFWQEYDRGEAKSIGRKSCEEYAVRVEWRQSNCEKLAKPDVRAAVEELLD